MKKIIEATTVIIALIAAVVGAISLYYAIWGDPLLGLKVFATCVITFLIMGGIANNI